MDQFKRGDKVRLVSLDKEMSLAGWTFWLPFVGREGTVKEPGSADLYIDVDFGHGDVFPALPHEIEKVSG